ncbi:hypothetical protein [Neobacillus niacini]|uniref:GNAT family N-acetyltransferase n=1 Tax=Neobacillus niacini TaxID=86668 RepID=UPI002855A219|nr:hypothetical protein [Neobacillus niacini]MDR6999907.1 RimJ/RimL family protein N-acetyltransferase [Neobacillus niacini]
MIKGSHIYIRPFVAEDAVAMLALQVENRTFFERFSMERREDFYSIESQLERIRKFEKDEKNDLTYNFGIFKDDGTLLGN